MADADAPGGLRLCDGALWGGGAQGDLWVCMVFHFVGMRADGGTGQCPLMFLRWSCHDVWHPQESINEGISYTNGA